MATYSQVCSAVGNFGYANRFTLYVVLTNRDGDPATNKSWVDYNVYFENTSGGGTFTSNTRLYFALNGGVIKDSTSSITGPRNGSVSIASGSTQIEHNSDGTKSISYHAIVKSTSFGISGEISGTFALTTIPRASSVSGGSGNIGGTTTISVSRASTSFTHTLKYAFGSLNGTIATGVGTSYTWTIPTSFYAQIPNAKSGTGTIYCETYNGSTLIGTKTTSFTATVTEASSRPTVSATLTDTNATTKALTGNASKIVKGKSTGQLVITSSVKNSATIKSVTVNGTNVGTAASITKTYANISTASFTIVTTDSRGFTNTSYVVTPSYVNYVPLTINANFFRPQPTTGEVKLTYSGNYFNGSFGQVNNELSMTWDYKEKSSSEWLFGGWITPVIDGNTIVQQTISLGTEFDYQKAYNFRAVIWDKLSTLWGYSDVSVGMPVFHWGKDFMSVNEKLKAVKGLHSMESGNVGTPVGNGELIIKRANNTECPNNGVVLEYGNYTNWVGQLYIGDNDYQGVYYNGWSNGVRGEWKKLGWDPVSLYDNTSGSNGPIELSQSAAKFSYIEIFYKSTYEHFSSVKIYSPNGRTALLSNFHVFPESGTVVGQSRAVTISGKSIATAGGNESYGHWWSFNNAIYYENKIYIYKVIGHR